jgi:hypothetical protein
MPKKGRYYSRKRKDLSSVVRFSLFHRKHGIYVRVKAHVMHEPFDQRSSNNEGTSSDPGLMGAPKIIEGVYTFDP